LIFLLLAFLLRVLLQQQKATSKVTTFILLLGICVALAPAIYRGGKKYVPKRNSSMIVSANSGDISLLLNFSRASFSRAIFMDKGPNIRRRPNLSGLVNQPSPSSVRTNHIFARENRKNGA
jgi:hypothetical protein